MPKHADIQSISKALVKEYYSKFFAIVCLFFAGCLLIYHFFGDNTILAVLGLFMVGTGLNFGWRQWRYRQTERHPLLQLLRIRSRRIVWVYSTITQRMPFGVQFSRNAYLHFKLVNGKEWVLSIPEGQIEEVMKALNRRLPHATFGYSQEKEQWYTAHPEMMYKD